MGSKHVAILTKFNKGDVSDVNLICYYNKLSGWNVLFGNIKTNLTTRTRDILVNT